uniref:Uncharacterized protein LOC114347371 n=1 Tax=Diabrotica virgifera virgifera TaxID=50390 RepID=A0A6P7H864_DIAVI
KYRIPDCCNIFTAEAAAIQKALTWCASNYCENVVVVSDSQAVLQAICSHPLDNFQNSSILDIKKTLHNLKSTKKTVTLLWVKGHSGVVGNEIVDGMAKNTSEIPEITNIFNFKDLFSVIRSVGRERWRSKYEDVQQTSRNHYFSIHPLLPKCIPHFNYNYNKVHSSLITRLKLNHGLFPEHLHRIGIYETPFCPCNYESIGDLNHVFLDCLNHRDQTQNLYLGLINLNISLPVSISNLLSYSDKSIFNILRA